jgi:ABC-type phosphate transport system permease subunit
LGGASCLVLAIVVVIVFAIPGVIYGCIAATLAFQNIMQRHYHILNKKELTKAGASTDDRLSISFSSNQILLVCSLTGRNIFR